MQFVLIPLLLCTLTNRITGQSFQTKKTKAIFITGVTFDSKTRDPLSGANFTLNHRISFSTNEKGRFSFFGQPNDTVIFTYLGYRPTTIIIPDTLRSEEYVMGVFLREQSVALDEVIILRRISPSSIIITPVPTDQKTMTIAQNNVDKATIEGLTRTLKVYDSDLNTRKAMRVIQMRSEYNGMLVTPENGFGLSTIGYKTHQIIYGAPILMSKKMSKVMLSNRESLLLLKYYDLSHKLNYIPQTDSNLLINTQK